ncbi:uncharacterized protein METZ01_LOCUS221137, partial [marine metagenome]
MRVLRAHPDKLHLVGAAAYANAEKLFSIAKEFEVAELCLVEPGIDACPPENANLR